MRAAVDLEIFELLSDGFDGVGVGISDGISDGISFDFDVFRWSGLVDFGRHVSDQVSLRK